MTKKHKFRFWTNDNKPFVASLHYFVINDGTKEKVLPDNISPFKPIQQYTGLKDMENQEIFVGDIINFSYGIPGISVDSEVIDKWGQFRCKAIGSKNKPDEIGLNDLLGMYDCIIVGNIVNK